MTETPKWPAYETGPRESLHAIGVASTNYVELESVIQFMFGTLFGLRTDPARIVFAKIGFEAATQVMGQWLARLDWPQKAKDDVAYFLAGISVCNENRNYLSHSNLMWGESYSTTVAFRTTKQGKILGVGLKLAELRQVADDIHNYTGFGRTLGNAINVHRENPPQLAAFPWPNRPAPPRKLEYQSGPIHLS
jgi:hypothetical protein